jgi:type IV pilus assembly protein PilP
MRVIVLSFALVFSLSGCEDASHTDIKQWMDESSSTMKAGVPPLPELKPFPAVSYNGSTQSDPFSAARIEPERKNSGANKPDLDRPREQLENYPTESIKFLGLVDKVSNGKRHAVVQAEGVLFQVTKGNYMGQNFGRIVDITKSEVVLKELVQDPSGETGDWIEIQTILELQAGSEGKESGK